MPVTWYLNVDMHLYLLSPILLFALWKFGYKCIPVIVSLLLYSIYQVYRIVLDNKFNMAMMLNFSLDVASKFYVPTHVRYPSWLIGVTIGYLLYRKRETPSTMSTVSSSLETNNINNRIFIPQFKNLFIWINVILLSIWLVIGLHFMDEYKTDVQLSALGTAPHRVLWTLCMAWIVYSCLRGRGGSINWFFSLPYWKPIAKLNYCNYLIHQPFILLMVRLMRVQLYFDGWIFFVMALGVYLFSLFVSIPWTLMFEIPFVNMEKAIWGIIEERKSKRFNSVKKEL